MDNRSYGSRHLKFLVAAIVILVGLDHFVLGGTRPYIEDARREQAAQQAMEPATPDDAAGPGIAELAALATQEPKVLDLARMQPEFKLPRKDVFREPFGPEEPPAWVRNAVPAPILGPNRPKVVIVIDDMGVSRAHSREVMEMNGPLTLAFLPYASGVAAMAAEARGQGHELLVHMPMEPMNGDLDTGAIVLTTGETPEEFASMLSKGLGAFTGYVGINNHMGSRLTQDKDAMRTVMAELKKRGLLFLDSRTIASSVAAESAAEAPVPYAVRDVFLDDDPSLESVRKNLAKTEKIALEYGQAIAIGHPKGNTIAGLKEWLPTLKEKGIALVPISAVVITKPSLSSVSAVADGQSEVQVPPHP